MGRPSLAVDNHIRPGERNPIERKFGQAKTAYDMNRIKARLADTSESWIASIVLVLNLIKLIGRASVSLLVKMFQTSVSGKPCIYTFLNPESRKIKFFAVT